MSLLQNWKNLSREIGAFQSRILLGIFYFVVVTPFGLLVRATGDPLSLRKTKATNWIARAEQGDVGLESGRKQF